MFVYFRSVREELQFTFSLDHPVMMMMGRKGIWEYADTAERRGRPILLISNNTNLLPGHDVTPHDHDPDRDECDDDDDDEEKIVIDISNTTFTMIHQR